MSPGIFGGFCEPAPSELFFGPTPAWLGFVLSGDPRVMPLRPVEVHAFTGRFYTHPSDIAPCRFNRSFASSDSSTLLRLDTFPPAALLGLTGFLGSPLVAVAELSYPARTTTLIASSDLPSWIPRVWRLASMLIPRTWCHGTHTSATFVTKW